MGTGSSRDFYHAVERNEISLPFLSDNVEIALEQPKAGKYEYKLAHEVDSLPKSSAS
jgi:hypothetical protein